MLDKCNIALLDPTTVIVASETSRFAVDRMQWRSFTLEHKRTVSQQTVKFTFKLPGTKDFGTYNNLDHPVRIF
ncbi:hypothetical protein Plhal304r1_c029g0094891 [Plasmopara halstedii]